MQTGLDVTCDHIRRLDLTYSPDMSEFIVISNDRIKKAEDYTVLIHLHMEETPISSRVTIRVLRLYLQYVGNENVWKEHIIKQINQIHRILARVTRRRHGHRENELRKTTEAVFYTRVMYHVPYVTLNKTRTNTLETLHKCTRLILGVPRFTPTHLLRQAGLFKSLNYCVTLHHHAQR